VATVEKLPGLAALKRSKDLVKPWQKFIAIYFFIFNLISHLVLFLIMSRFDFLWSTVFYILVSGFTSITSALVYIKLRQSNGESLKVILSNFK
jgi:hypothetical protein